MQRVLSRRLPFGAFRLRGSAVGVTFALLAVSCAGAARAQDKPPAPDASSVAQYVELIPTASGSTAPGVRGDRRFPLPPAAKRALAKTSRSTAKALAIVATSSTYGALPTPPGARPAGVALPAVDGSSRDRSLRAMATAVAPTGEIRMIALLLILLALTAGGAALSVRRGRF